MEIMVVLPKWTMKLSDILEEHFRISPHQKQGLKKLQVFCVEDLLRYYPVRYGDTSKATTVSNLKKGDLAAIFGKIKNLETKKGFKSRIPMARASVKDSTGTVGIVWFHQPYLAKILREGTKVRVEGKVSEGKNGKYFSNPKIEEVAEIPEISGESLFAANEKYSDAPATIYPVYSETRFISSSWLFHHIQKVFKSGALDNVIDPIPKEMLSKYSLPTLKTAFIWLHAPRRINDFEAARKRFAFEEVFLIQLQKQIERAELSKMKSVAIKDARKIANDFAGRLPFPLTGAQEKAIETISKEMETGRPMSRLLEGDVGRGKTAVAAATKNAPADTQPQGSDN